MANNVLTAVQTRILFDTIQHYMLQQLKPCNGSKTVSDLLVTLHQEVGVGVPSPVPEWYDFPKSAFDTAAVGYNKCETRGCFRAEDLSTQLEYCSACKMAFYCSVECQKGKKPLLVCLCSTLVRAPIA